MARLLAAGFLSFILFTPVLFAQETAKAPTAPRPQGAPWFDLSKLGRVDVETAVRDGLNQGQIAFDSVLKEADARIADIKSRPGYTALDYDILISPWIKTKGLVELMRDSKPLPEIKLAFRGQRNGIFDTGGTAVFKGKARRGLEIMREIGLKDTANGKSWSEMWGIMERTATPLGVGANGDLAVRVDVILGVNQWFDIIYKQISNVRDVERYAERDLGGDRYVIIQDMIRDDSAQAAPRGPVRKKRPPKAYVPIREQISITVISDNKDGSFTLGSFMSTHGQELKASGVARFGEFFVDLLTVMEKDSIKNRQKWNEQFQKEVLRTAEK